MVVFTVWQSVDLWSDFVQQTHLIWCWFAWYTLFGSYITVYFFKSSVISQKGESQNGFLKKKHAKFFEKRTFFTLSFSSWFQKRNQLRWVPLNLVINNFGSLLYNKHLSLVFLSSRTPPPSVPASPLFFCGTHLSSVPVSSSFFCVFFSLLVL